MTNRALVADEITRYSAPIISGRFYCALDANGWERTQVLFNSWKAWSDRSGERTGTLKQFVRALEQRGRAQGVFYARHPKTKTRGFRGIRLIGDTIRYAVDANR